MRRAIIAVLLILIAVTVVAFLAPRVLRASGPAQPIAFSHAVHAGDRQIACAYCHRHVAESTVAGIPSVEICAGCHFVVRPDSPQVQLVLEYANNQQPIPWVRVYQVPDFVYFSHQMHIAAAVDCAECHGNVSEMNRISQAQPLTMGWCLDCHRSREAPTDCWTCHE